jgi:hypothetical protein
MVKFHFILLGVLIVLFTPMELIIKGFNISYNMYLVNFGLSNLVVRIKFSIEFETKHWKHLFAGSYNETKHY